MEDAKRYVYIVYYCVGSLYRSQPAILFARCLSRISPPSLIACIRWDWLPSVHVHRLLTRLLRVYTLRGSGRKEAGD